MATVYITSMAIINGARSVETISRTVKMGLPSVLKVRSSTITLIDPELAIETDQPDLVLVLLRSRCGLPPRSRSLSLRPSCQRRPGSSGSTLSALS